MVISTKQLRNLGVKVLLDKFGSSLFENEVQLLALFNQVRLKPYSFLSWYKVINKKGALYAPIEELCLKCSPLLDVKQPTEAEKRKFRNSINTMVTLLKNWNISNSEAGFIESALIAIPVIEGYLYGDNKDEYGKLICEMSITSETWEDLVWDMRAFIIDLYFWYNLTSSDSAVEENGLTQQDLLNILLFSNNMSFYSYVLAEKKKRWRA